MAKCLITLVTNFIIALYYVKSIEWEGKAGNYTLLCCKLENYRECYLKEAKRFFLVSQAKVLIK